MAAIRSINKIQLIGLFFFLFFVKCLKKERDSLAFFDKKKYFFSKSYDVVKP